MSLFAIQILSAFLFGGLIIALVTLLVEHSPPALRGIIMTFPNTMIVTYIFLALTLGSNQVIDTLPGLFIALISAMPFSFSYVVAAQYFEDYTPHHKWPIIICLIIASLIWLIFPLLLPQSLLVAVFGFIVSLAVFQPLMARYADKFEPPQLSRTYSFKQLMFRACFAGLVVALSTAAARISGAYWGAIIGLYPAAIGSQFILFQSEYGAKALPPLVKSLAMGLINCATYGITVAYAYPSLGIVLGTMLGLVSSIATARLTTRITSRDTNRHISTNTPANAPRPLVPKSHSQ